MRDAPAARSGAHLTIIRAVRVAAIIPAFNEESSLPLVLQAIPAGLLSEVVVVDNGSTDGTARMARAHGATVLSEPRRGYGRGCLTGIDCWRSRRPDIAVFLDADYSDHPEELPLLLEPLRRGEADLAIGARTRNRREPGSMLPQAIFGNRLATRLIRVPHGDRFTDLGPFRARCFDCLLALEMRDPDFGWTAEIQIRALARGLRTKEAPVSYRRRVGVSKITGTRCGALHAGVKILWTILRAQAGGRERAGWRSGRRT